MKHKKPGGMGGERSMERLERIEQTLASLSVSGGALPAGDMALDIVSGLHVALAKAHAILPKDWSDMKCELTLHKYRYEIPQVDRVKREQSREWLEKRGFHRLHMAPWPPAGQLPDD